MNSTFKDIYLSDLQVGDILVFPAPEESWLSQAIALLTDSTVSHGALMSEVGAKYIIAETTTKGLIYDPLPNASPYVLRYNLSDTQKKELRRIVQAYIAEENDYGYPDLITLGLLLLYKKFTKKTLSHKIFYQFLTVISVQIQNAIQKYVSKGKHPMVCSQFVAQCYTDAGCDLKFSKMVIAYDEINKAITEANNMERGSLHKTANNKLEEIAEDPLTTNELNINKDNITKNFVKLLRAEKNDLTQMNNTNNDAMKQFKTNIFAESSLAQPVQKLIEIMKPLLSELSKASAKNKNKTSTLRNCFVTPADLLCNCTNITKIGQLKMNKEQKKK